MDRRALLAGGATLLAGCLPLRGEPAPPPPNANYPRMLATIEWLPDEPGYRVRMTAGNRFTPDNTGAVTVVVDAQDYRRVAWVGSAGEVSTPAQSFPLDVGDELVVPSAERGTVRVVWESPEGDRSVALDTLDRAAQPTATPTSRATSDPQDGGGE
ncbi:hypothetical protein [Haloglomus litoreum]|uniref:hypothetical protein n=1 Tax=Haloglomus litoreum TaxID=3034026 RepID=UPI0023E8BEB5|nr:hypothetical protein [Haloglomus sp. DT116]